MTEVERYLRQLSDALHTRGRSRRRLLAECRDHLADAAAAHGDDEAVRRFGTPAELAESFDTDIAARRAVRSTFASVVGVFAVGASTVTLLNAADARASAVTVWAVIFFACAQTAMVSALLSTLQVAGMRRHPTSSADVALMCRRNLSALGFSAIALFAAGAAVPGHASAWMLLLGPAAAALAATCVVRARSPVRHLRTYSHRIVRAPLADLMALVRRLDDAHSPAGISRPFLLLVPTVVVAIVAAFLWDHLDHGTLETSFMAAGIEATMTVLGFVLLGPVLGLRPGRKSSRGGMAT